MKKALLPRAGFLDNSIACACVRACVRVCVCVCVCVFSL